MAQPCTVCWYSMRQFAHDEGVTVRPSTCHTGILIMAKSSHLAWTTECWLLPDGIQDSKQMGLTSHTCMSGVMQICL